MAKDAESKQIATVITKDEYKSLREIAFREEKSISSLLRDIVLDKIKKEKKQNGNTMS